MDKTLVQSLKQLGCHDKHARFYRANLYLGAASLPDITKAAHLPRSTAYIVASEMVNLGLTIEDHRTYRKLYTAAEPDTIFRMVESKYRQLGRSNLALKEILPELRAAHQATTSRPRVRTFEGNTGLMAVWRDILQSTDEILLWTNQATEQVIFDGQAHDTFIRERLSRNIPIKVLAVNNKEGRLLQETDNAHLRSTKILPPTTSFSSETYIYGDTVAVLDYGQNIFGVTTQNKQIATSQRAIFYGTWASL